MNDVKRYDPVDEFGRGGCMSEEPDGDYVMHADYSALRARLDAVEKINAKLGWILGFLGDDEARISAFLDACGPDLISRARRALAGEAKR